MHWKGKIALTARISAFDVTNLEDRLMLRAVVDFWWAPFTDTKRGGEATPLSGWVRLHHSCYCPNQNASSEGSVQTNVRRPTAVYCGECRAQIAVDAQAPSMRLLV